MYLTTERLKINRLHNTDWPLFQRLHQDPRTMEWIGDVPDDDDLQQRFTSRLAPWLKTSFHMLCVVLTVKATGEAIGMMGVNAEWKPYAQAEIGYTLLPHVCGQGYGSEALAAVCDFLLNECEFHKLKASVVEGNWASRRILEKNGFLLEGTLRDNYLLRGEWVNDWVFGRLNARP
jgi:RimJ/RimL family protein N-acetyltransferase